MLTAADKQQLDDLAANLTSARGYILELTGGTDSVGDANYNYQLSQRRADAVANYLQSKYNIPPHKFYLVGIGKDQQIASDSTAAGRAKNRRVEIKLLSNMSDQQSATTHRPVRTASSSASNKLRTTTRNEKPTFNATRPVCCRRVASSLPGGRAA